MKLDRQKGAHDREQQLTGLGKFTEKNEKLVGLLMFRKKGHL